MMYSYYMTQRPPMPGAQPDGMVSFVEYDRRQYIPELGRDAWAIIRYERELLPEEISDYELTPAEIRVTLTPSEVNLILTALFLVPGEDDDSLTERAHELFDKLREEV